MADSARRGLGRVPAAVPAAVSAAVPAAVKGGAVLALGWVGIFAFARALDALPYDYADARALSGLFAIGWTWTIALVLGTMLLPLGFAARTVARARVRAGLPDPLDRVRRWRETHPRWTRALLVVPPLASFAFVAGVIGFPPLWGLLERIPTAAASLALYPLARSLVRALLAPTLDATAPKAAATTEGDITFDAVAVTRETRAAVGAMAALSIAVLALAVGAGPGHVPGVPVFLAYVVVALGGALLFRRASRVAVGADGVYVTGTSRTRFFAYRDLDAARVSGSDIELVRRGRVVLRLQLHGEDAARRDEVLERMRAAIDRVKGGDGAVAGALVQAASSAALARAALGAGDFRQPAITREALWELVEGPATDLASRTAAAKALASTLDPTELPRLRVAATRCAEPEARFALEQLAEIEAIDDGPAATAAGRRASSR